MSRRAQSARSLFDLVNEVEMTPDLVTRLVALALMQGHIAAAELYEVVVPLLPPSQRTFPVNLARRIGHGDILCETFLRELETFLDALEGHVEAGTHVGWEADEHHVLGGYETTFHGPGIPALARSKRELDLLRDTVLKAISVARAMREAGALLEG